MKVSSAALVVIDMQNGFLNDRSRHIIPTVARLVEDWEAVGGSIIFTRYLNYPDSPYERLIHWSRMQTAPETDITPELQEHASRARVIDKVIYSLFNEGGFAAVKEGGWTDLIFCGVATESCVLKSAVDAFELGYTPWVVQDACASHAGAQVHDNGLQIIGRFIGGGQITTADQLKEYFYPAPQLRRY